MESAWGLYLMERWGLKSAHRGDPALTPHVQNGSRARWAYPGTTGHPRQAQGSKATESKATVETPARPGWAGPFVV